MLRLFRTRTRTRTRNRTRKFGFQKTDSDYDYECECECEGGTLKNEQRFASRRWVHFVILAALLLIPLIAYGQVPRAVREPFMEVFWRYRWQYLKGTLVTIQISVLAMMLASAFGLVLALTRVYGNPILARLALAYVEFVRGTPLLVQLYFIFYGLPNLPYLSDDPEIRKLLTLDRMVAAVVGVGLNYAAYEAEIYRAGILAIPRAQTEAALALGLSKFQTIRMVVLPQAFRLVVPPVTNDFVALFKDTSIVSIVGLTELTQTFFMSGNQTQRFLGFAIVTSLIYFALSYPISKFARHLEARIHPHYEHEARA